MSYFKFIDPPVVDIRFPKLTGDSNLRKIQCIAKGEPDSYRYFQWEHRSQYNEHIRYLDSSDDGILQLPDVKVSNRYQDTGIYICNVSNGIPDDHGKIFKQGRAFFESKGINVMH